MGFQPCFRVRFTLKVQGESGGLGLGYVDINSVSFGGYPETELSQHNPFRDHQTHPVQNDRDQICLPSLGHSLSFVPSFAPTVCLSIWRLGSFIKRPPRVSNYLLSLLKREALLATTDGRGRHGLPAGCSCHPRIWKCAREHGERPRRLLA